ncbi:MAG: hypothetical protein HFH68_08520 [Lachnospiraceae bacterium]|nr:hypothetical protein [Lachnospiraceae bacterium]
MLKEEKKEMQENLLKLYKKGIFNSAYIVIFGSNEPAERIVSWLLEKDITPEAMIDNNKLKHGMSYKGIPVESPEKILSKMHDNAVILVASKYYNEMVQQLEVMGYKEEKHIYRIVNMAKGSTSSVTENTFTEKEIEIRKGWDIYKKIIARHGKGIRLFICPFPALGDVYLVGKYLDLYCKKKNINSYLVTVASGACMEVLSMFGINQTEKLSKEESDSLVQCLIFAGLEECNAEILHHRFPYTAGTGVLGNYKNLCFSCHYKYSLFDMDRECTGKIPERQSDAAYIDSLFQKNGLIKGKTVIISPYANTSSNLPESFWIKLAREYADKGYTVCTNSCGDEEPAITGTKALTFPIKAAIQAVEAAGTFIGLRSGLCDVISSAKAEKIIIYPDRVYQGGRYIDFYSLRNMGLCMDVEEKVADSRFQGEVSYV